MIFLILLTLAAYLFYITFVKPMQYWKKQGIKYIKPYPIVGNSGDIVFQRKNWAHWVQSMYHAYDDTRYIGVYQFTKPSLLIKDPELLKQLAIKDFDHFTGRGQLVKEDVEPIFSKNLLSIRGQRWKQMRATLSPTFTGTKMRAMFILMRDCAEKFVKHMEKRVTSTANQQPLEIELRDQFGRFATEVIGSTVFGINCDALENENSDFYQFAKQSTNFSATVMFLKVMGYQFFNPLMKFFQIKIFPDNLVNFFRNILDSNIREREEKGIIRPDMIHLLLEAKKGKLKHEYTSRNKADDDTGFATVDEDDTLKDTKIAPLELTDDDILAQAFIFFLAGFDGISQTMSHMAYELAIHQDMQKSLQDEIDETLLQCNGLITYEKLIKMKYMDMVFSEILRKWAVPVMDRLVTTPYTIPAERPGEVPVTLQPEDIILLPIFAIHRDPKNFEDPDKFDPERFSDENKHKIKPFTYLPFGIGPRNCIGSRFAIMEVKLIIFYVLSKFDLVLTEKSEVPIVLTTSKINVTPRNGFWLGLKMRKSKSN